MTECPASDEKALLDEINAIHSSSVYLMKLSSIMISQSFTATETERLKTLSLKTERAKSATRTRSIIASQLMLSTSFRTPKGMRLATKTGTGSRRIFLLPPVRLEYVSNGEDTGATLRTMHTLN